MTRQRDTQEATPTPFEAFRDLVHAYGVPKLAQKMMVRPGTLYNKADADAQSHNQPTLRDVIQATSITGDFAVLDSLESMFDRAAFDLRNMGHLSDEALIELLLKLGQANGDFQAALHKAFTDKHFSTREYHIVRSEALDIVGALMTLVVRLEGLVDE